jgi:hypothetical protein
MFEVSNKRLASELFYENLMIDDGLTAEDEDIGRLAT